MRFFFCVARGCGPFPRGRLLRAPRYPRRELYRRQFYRHEAAVFCRDGVPHEFDSGRRCVEGVFAQWSWSRSAADGGAWMKSLATSIDRLQTAGREGPGGLLRSMEHIWREEKSGSRGGPGDARGRAFAKPSAAWQLCQVCSLICQVAQNANSKCKTVGYLILRFLANYKNANFKCKTVKHLQEFGKTTHTSRATLWSDGCWYVLASIVVAL